MVGLCGDRMTALAAGPPAPPLAPSLSGARVSEPSIRTDLLQLSAGTTGTSPLSAPVPSVAVTLREDHGDEDAIDGEEEEEEVDRLPGETALSRRLRDRRGDHPRPLEPLFSRDDDLEEREQLRPEDLAPYRHSVDRVRSFLNEEEEEGPSLAEKRRRGEAGGREGGRA